MGKLLDIKRKKKLNRKSDWLREKIAVIRMQLEHQTSGHYLTSIIFRRQISFQSLREKKILRFNKKQLTQGRESTSPLKLLRNIQ